MLQECYVLNANTSEVYSISEGSKSSTHYLSDKTDSTLQASFIA